MNLFYLIGTMTDGMSKENLIQIYETAEESKEQFEAQLKTLIDISLIQEDKENHKFKVTQFI